MIEENPRITGYLDHTPEKIVNAAQIILGQSDGLYVFLKIPSSDLTGVFPLPLGTSLVVILTDFLKAYIYDGYGKYFSLSRD